MKITVKPEWSIIRLAHLENILLTRAIPDFPSSMELWHSYQFALRMTEIDFLFEKSVFCCNHYFSRCKYINFEDRSDSGRDGGRNARWDYAHVGKSDQL